MASPSKSISVIDSLRRRGYRVERAGRMHLLAWRRPGQGWGSLRLTGPELWAFAKLEGAV